MRLSHEALRQSLFVQGRGASKRALAACLRTGQVPRAPRARVRGRGTSFVFAEVMIGARPAEGKDRAVPGHWEGDLILGVRRSAIPCLAGPCQAGSREGPTFGCGCGCTLHS